MLASLSYSKIPHTSLFKHLYLEEAGMWCLIITTGLENGKQVVKRTGMVGHKLLSTKKLVVESLSDIV